MAEGNEPRPVDNGAFIYQRDARNSTTFTFTLPFNNTSTFRACLVFQHEQMNPSMFVLGFDSGTNINAKSIEKIFGNAAYQLTSASLSGSQLNLTFNTTAYGGCSILWLN